MKRSLVNLVLLSAACSVTDTGNPVRDPGGEQAGGSNYCDETPHDIESSEASSLGFTAADIAQLVEGLHTQTLAWLEGELANGSFSGATELEVTVELAGSARFVDSEPKETDGEGAAIGEIGTYCNDRLELDATLTIETADGALDEVVDVVLEAESSRIARASFALDADQLGGQLEVELSAPAGYELDGPPKLSFDVQIADVGFAGSIGASATYRGDGAVAAGGGGLLARWPDTNGCDSGFPVAIEQSESFQEISASFNGRGPLQLSYEPTAPGAELTYQLTTSSEQLCEQLDGVEAGAVQLPAELELVSNDGVIDGVFDVQLYAQREASGAVSRVQVSMAETSEAPDEFLEMLGIHQSVDFTGYDHGQVVLSAELYGGELNGALSVRGADVADCVTNPPEPDPDGMGAPGCRGTDYFDLWVARFGE